MTSRSIIATLLFLSSICVYSCHQEESSETILSQSAKDWKTDLQYLAEELPQLHKNSYHSISKDDFREQVNLLSQKIDQLNADQIIVELMGLVALIGDGHTHLDLPQSLDRYPLEIAKFGDDYRVIVTNDENEDVLGARLMAVDDVSMDTVHKRLTRLVPRGENLDRTLFSSLQFLGSPEILHGLDITKNKNNVSFTFLNDQGQTVKKRLHPQSLRGSSFRMIPKENVPLILQNFQQAWWCKYLPEQKTIYFGMNSYPGRDIFERRTEELSALIDSFRAEKLIIDFRRNQGGDFDLFRSFLLPMLQSKPDLSRKGIYVITGPATFSASMVNTMDIKNQLNGIQVGLPTGARPNSYSEHGDFALPNSHLRVSYSREYYRFANDTDTAVIPDIIIKQSWPEYKSGKDNCLDWILQDN